MDPKKKFYLFKQSETFCAVPWNHIKVEMDGRIVTCVNGQHELGHLKNNSIEEIVNDWPAQHVRDNTYKEYPNYNCRTCSLQESDTGYKFLRDLYNPMFKHADIDYSDKAAFQLNAIDLHWSSTCNLKCVTCWAKQSSAIAQEQGEPIQHTPDEQADTIIDLIVSRQHHMKEIYLSGGEPTLIKHNVRLLKQLDKSIDCTFRVNTNMMFEQNNPVITELLKFKNVLITISADATGNRFEYIRREANWHKFLNNLQFLKDTHFNIRVNSVFFVASALYLTDTQKFFHDGYGITDFTINQVTMGHTNIQCRNLSQDLKDKCAEKIINHKSDFPCNQNLIGQLDNCLGELQNPKEEDYQPFFESFADRVDVDWRDIFTEL
jgi:radical SAM protein with 4Fe4S-binding SPASM domain